MLTADFVRDRILASIPGAAVDVLDTTGGGDHFQAVIRSERFAGLTRVQQHKLVYAAVQAELQNGSIHALSLKTETP